MESMIPGYKEDDPNFHVVITHNQEVFCFTLLPNQKMWLGIIDGEHCTIDVAKEPDYPFYED